MSVITDSPWLTVQPVEYTVITWGSTRISCTARRGGVISNAVSRSVTATPRKENPPVPGGPEGGTRSTRDLYSSKLCTPAQAL